MRLVELDYSRDSTLLFSQIAAEPWSIFLDSGYPRIDSGRYDIMSAGPYRTLVTYGSETRITEGEDVHYSDEDPFALVKQQLGERRINLSGFPFSGGALGYFSYDLGRRIEQLPALCRDDINMPDMAIGLYDWAVIADHHKRRTWLIAADGARLGTDEWKDLQELFSTEQTIQEGEHSVQSLMLNHTEKDQYTDAFKRIQNYIRDGDCYQVNLAQRFSIAVTGASWSIYRQLRQSNPAPYACFFRLDQGC